MNWMPSTASSAEQNSRLFLKNMQDRRFISLDQLRVEPFRIFFFLGALCCLIGTAFWPLKTYGIAFADVSTKFHVWIQIYGFMTCFVVGFLGTAIPHVTQSRPFSWSELLTLLGLQCAVILMLALGHYFYAHLCHLSMIVVLVGMLSLRVARRKGSLPDSFILIPFAFVSLLLGNCLHLLLYLGVRWRPVELTELSQNLIFQGFLSFLIVGVGGFLIRGVFGGPQFPGQSLSLTNTHMPKALPLPLHFVCGVALLCSFPVESFLHDRLGLLLRAVAVSIEVFGQLRSQRKPTGGRLAAGWIRWAMILLVLGFWGALIAPGVYRLPFLHLCFAGGFGITTFCVATWIIFNHGGYEHLLTQRHRPLTAALVFFMIALACRVSAEFLPNSYESHLAYAGLFWAGGVIIWASSVLFKVLFFRPVETPDVAK